MARRRRTAAEAQEEILDAAERLLLEEGPGALKIARVAKSAGMSHPGLLHHFGTAEQLHTALHRRTSARIREELLGLLAGGEDRATAFALAMKRLADPEKGRLLAWVVASGGEPFPPVEEQGLAAVAQRLQVAGDEGSFRVLLVVLAMLGDSMFGDAARDRLGLTPEDAPRFRRWLLELLAA
jgi:AcrR family transcriptional regulator